MPDQFDPDFPTRYRKLPVTVEAIRGEILYGDESLKQFPAESGAENG